MIIEEPRFHKRRKKILCRQDNASCHKSRVLVLKMQELLFELLQTPSSQGLASMDYWLFTKFKKMLNRKGFFSNEAVITDTEDYFSTKKNPVEKGGKNVGHIVSFLM